MNLTLDSRLKESTYLLANIPLRGFDDSLLLLSKNALFSWFILVPSTQETEFHKLSPEQQLQTQHHINDISHFIEKQFSPDKINIATIGNIVSQLHVHIIGRSKNDACWPGVVWGNTQFKKYEKHEVTSIRNNINKQLN